MSVDISIIVPVYNVEKYLRECLDSVVNQNFTAAYEIILVNDGSTDGSLSICEEYKSKHDNIVVISQRNGGLSNARNSGLKIANGEYIAFVDSDDYISPDYLKALYKPAADFDADIVIGGFKMFGNTEQSGKFQVDSNECGKLLNPEQFYRLHLSLPLLIFMPAWNKLIRKSTFTDNSISFPEGKNYEDIATNAKLYEKSNRFVFSNSIVYYYRRDSVGAITGNMYRSISIKDINDIFFAASEICGISVNTIPESLEKAYKLAAAGSVWVFFMEYQLKALESHVITDKLEKNYLLFGASTWAEKYLKLLNGRVESVLLSDNDKNKHGKMFYGHLVIPPDDLLKQEHRKRKIVITSGYFMEIYFQLKEMGVIRDLSDLMPYKGKTFVENMYVEWIEKLETLLS